MSQIIFDNRAANYSIFIAFLLVFMFCVYEHIPITVKYATLQSLSVNFLLHQTNFINSEHRSLLLSQNLRGRDKTDDVQISQELQFEDNVSNIGNEDSQPTKNTSQFPELSFVHDNIALIHKAAALTCKKESNEVSSIDHLNQAIRVKISRHTINDRDSVFDSIVDYITILINKGLVQTVIEYHSSAIEASLTYTVSNISIATTCIQIRKDKTPTNAKLFDPFLASKFKTDDDMEQSAIINKIRSQLSPIPLPLNVYLIQEKLQKRYKNSWSSNPLQGPYYCFQILLQLEDMAHGYLPLEFERKLGNTLCRCNSTLFRRSLPDTAFFTYWESLQQLITNSLISLSPATCNITLTDGTTLYGEALPYRLKYSYYLAARSDLVSSSTFGSLISVADLLSVEIHPQSLKNLLGAVSAMSSSEVLNETSFNVDRVQYGRLLVLGASVGKQNNTGFPRGWQLTGNNEYSASSSSNSIVSTRRPTRRYGVESLSGAGQYRSSSVSESTQAVTSAPTQNSSIYWADLVAVSEYPTNLPTEPVISRRLITNSRSTSKSSSSSSSKDEFEPENRLFGQWQVTENLNEEEVSNFDEELKFFAVKVDEYFSFNLNETASERNSKNEDYSLSTIEKAVMRKRLSLLHSFEEAVYMRWLDIFHQQFVYQESNTYLNRDSSISIQKVSFSSPIGFDHGFSELKSSRLIYLFGRRISLLSARLSRELKKYNEDSSNSVRRVGSVVSVLSPDESTLLTHDYLVTRILDLDNNIVTVALLASLLGCPDRADVSIVQADIVIDLLIATIEVGLSKSDADGRRCNFDLWFESFASLLLLSSVTYVEIPSYYLLTEIINRMTRQCVIVWKSVIFEHNSSSSLLSNTFSKLENGCTISVQNYNKYENSLIFDNNENSNSIYRVSIKFPVLSKTQTGYSYIQTRSSLWGVSVYTLLNFGVIEYHRKHILKMLLDIPLPRIDSLGNQSSTDAIFPWELYLRQYSAKRSSSSYSTLWYHPFSQNATKAELEATSDFNEVVIQSKRRKKFKQNIESSYDSNLEKLSLRRWRALGSEFGVAVDVGVTFGGLCDRSRAKWLWSQIQQELSTHDADLNGGKFSFVEHNSGYGFVSAAIARRYPNATVLSLDSNAKKTAYHTRLLSEMNVKNNVVCTKKDTEYVIFKHISESPELFRYQLYSVGLMEGFREAISLPSWGENVGNLIISALTSFIVVPSPCRVSWAMSIIYPHKARFVSNSWPSFHGNSESDEYWKYLFNKELHNSFPLRKLSNFETEELYKRSIHPTERWKTIDSDLLLKTAKLSANSTSLKYKVLNSDISAISSGSILMRIDVVNMTRYVHHHYNYKKDGHKRTYTMVVQVNDSMTSTVKSVLSVDDVSRLHSNQYSDHVSLSFPSTSSLPSSFDPVHGNEGMPVIPLPPINLEAHSNSGTEYHLPSGLHVSDHGIVSINLYRDKDSFPIPYTSLYGITLISALRMGLVKEHKDRMLTQFLQLPLYEDMAPWNIVLMGPLLDYIDFDTKQFIFDQDVPKAYMVMAILMNYKRTIEDFGRCGKKAGTVYGLPYVAECVGSVMEENKPASCPDMRFAVPCGDGKCHSDYISCLRAITQLVDILGSRTTDIASLTEDANLLLKESGSPISRGQEGIPQVSSSSLNDSGTFYSNGVRFINGNAH